MTDSEKHGEQQESPASSAGSEVEQILSSPVDLVRLDRSQRPHGMTLTEWQIALRREFARTQHFQAENIGDDEVFSEYRVTNPANDHCYRVAIRGMAVGANYCSCPDYETNQLGTCKHIEWLLFQLQQNAKIAEILKAGFLPPYTEIYLEYAAERRVRCQPGSECPADVQSLLQEHFGGEGVLPVERVAELPRLLKLLHQSTHEVRCYDDVLNYVAEVRDRQARREHLETVYPVGPESSNLMHLLQVPLTRHQRQAALFAAKTGRCLLADGPGWHVEAQALAAAEILASECGVEHVTIVCATEQLWHWAERVSRLTGRESRIISAASQHASTEEDGPKQEFDFPYSVVSHGEFAARLDCDHPEHTDLVILTDVERIADDASGVRAFLDRIQAPYFFVVSCTFWELPLPQLIALVQTVDRHRLGPTYRFLDEQRVSLIDSAKRGQQHTGDAASAGNAAEAPEAIPRIQNPRTMAQALSPVLFCHAANRQSGDDIPSGPVTAVPPDVDWLPMTIGQHRLHEEHRRVAERILERAERQQGLREPEQRRLIVALQSMRMSCNSSFLLDRSTDQSVKPAAVIKRLVDIFRAYGSRQHATPTKSKVVVFSQWTRTLELVQQRLPAETGIDSSGVVLYHGGVTNRGRRELTRRFHEDPACRVFLATDTAGVGLMLEPANAVIHMDVPWSPQIRSERLSRVRPANSRVADRPLTEIQLVTAESIEASLWEIHRRQEDALTAALQASPSTGFLAGSELTEYLNTLRRILSEIPTAAPHNPAAVLFDANTDAEDFSSEPQPNLKLSRSGSPAARLTSDHSHRTTDENASTMHEASPSGEGDRTSPRKVKPSSSRQRGQKNVETPAATTTAAGASLESSEPASFDPALQPLLDWLTYGTSLLREAQGAMNPALNTSEQRTLGTAKSEGTSASDRHLPDESAADDESSSIAPPLDSTLMLKERAADLLLELSRWLKQLDRV